tara:strand:+ start:549 stop:701 length:153 start_codon:yes stop_codon:yes gene_type:complete
MTPNDVKIYIEILEKAYSMLVYINRFNTENFSINIAAPGMSIIPKDIIIS